ncbi:MAG: hypothetical protein WBP55_09665, partial [Solirubrobacterales bacterium]
TNPPREPGYPGVVEKKIEDWTKGQFWVPGEMPWDQGGCPAYKSNETRFRVGFGPYMGFSRPGNLRARQAGVSYAIGCG